MADCKCGSGFPDSLSGRHTQWSCSYSAVGERSCVDIFWSGGCSMALRMYAHPTFVTASVYRWSCAR
ncbi:hypothetical protein [Rubritalea tangerina]|uniref:hypothetical protein n=1 Tax=Rubritalea tangerina TaxID=430798 RepID=UPI00360C8392